MGTPSRSALLGYSTCWLCGGKTHVKQRQDVEGKHPYSHCLDSNERGCNHTTYARNAAEARLMLEKTRPVAAGPAADDAKPAAAPVPAAPAPVPAPAAPAPVKRSRLFGA